MTHERASRSLPLKVSYLALTPALRHAPWRRRPSRMRPAYKVIGSSRPLAAMSFDEVGDSRLLQWEQLGKRVRLLVGHRVHLSQGGALGRGRGEGTRRGSKGSTGGLPSACISLYGRGPRSRPAMAAGGLRSMIVRPCGPAQARHAGGRRFEGLPSRVTRRAVN